MKLCVEVVVWFHHEVYHEMECFRSGGNAQRAGILKTKKRTKSVNNAGLKEFTNSGMLGRDLPRNGLEVFDHGRKRREEA
jgi:hypothetical protein